MTRKHISTEKKNKYKNSQNQRKQIFISYSRNDRVTVDRIVNDLRKKHYIIWMDIDEQGIEPGEDWRKELKDQMSKSEGMIACISPDWISSIFCQAESDQAKAEGKPIYPIIVRGLKPSQSLGDTKLDHLQIVDLTQNYKDGLKRLANVLPRPLFPRKLVLQRAVIVISTVLLIMLTLTGIALSAGLGQRIFPDSPLITSVPPSPTPSLADKDMGIIVAYFSLPSDDSVDAREADLLVERFSNLLFSELTEAAKALRITIGTLSPYQVSRVEGQTASERQENARDLARSYGADVVVYGEIRNGEFGIELQPEYYVAEDSFFDAQEMTGGFRFGTEILINEPISNAIDTQRELSSRTVALAQVIIGLSNYLAGDYEESLQAFQLASGVPDWAETEGREVLNILMGNVHLKLAQQEAQSTCNRDEVLEQLDSAIGQYEQASALSPEYSRSYAGLASANYLYALWLPLESDGCPFSPTGYAQLTIDLEKTFTALDFVDQAKSVSEQPLEIGVQSKLLLTEAQSLYLILSVEGMVLRNPYDAESIIGMKLDNAQLEQLQLEYDGFRNDFSVLTEQIILNYGNGRNASVGPLLIEGYRLRGLLATDEGDLRKALEEFNAALEVESIGLKDRMSFYALQAFIYCELGQPAESANFYTESLEIANKLKQKKEAEYYETELLRLDRGDCLSLVPDYQSIRIFG